VEAKQGCETLAVTANGGNIDGNGTQKQEDMKHEELATDAAKDSRIYVRSYKAAPEDVEYIYPILKFIVQFTFNHNQF
jgi:hypothetical protein